jgi:aspartate 1-decarboxylase
MQPPDTTMWLVNDVVNIGSLQQLRIVASHPDERFTTYSLIATNGETFRYLSGQAEAVSTGFRTPIAHRLVDMQLPHLP